MECGVYTSWNVNVFAHTSIMCLHFFVPEFFFQKAGGSTARFAHATAFTQENRTEAGKCTNEGLMALPREGGQRREEHSSSGDLAKAEKALACANARHHVVKRHQIQLR